MLALSSEYSFMTIDRLTFNHEHNVRKSGIVYYGSHISYQAIHGLIIYLIFLKFTDVKDTNIIQPFASIESSKNKELLSSYNASCMPLPSSWSFFEFQRMTPSHGLRVKNIQVVGWYDLFERSASAIIPTEKINFIANQICSVSSQSFWRGSTNLGFCP